MIEEALAELARGAEAYADDRLDEARAAFETAFQGLHGAGERRGSARVAMVLGELHWSTLGNPAAGRGWIERARRLLADEGPCVEWGYWELARLACDRPDVDDLAASAERALEIARVHGDVALEVRALADAGLARISQGHVRAGFRLLDEALAPITNGEVTDPYVIGTTFCSLLTSCDRSGDLQRADEWLRLIDRIILVPMGNRPRILHTHCRIAYGAVLSAAGRWDEAEAALMEALGPAGSASVGHRIEAVARLAEVRAQQGRLDEAEQLLSTIEDHVAAAGTLGLVHLRRGAPDLAAAVLRQGVRQLVGDVLRGAPLVGLLVEAELARGAVGAADDAVQLLRSMSLASDSATVACWFHCSTAHIALATGRAADAVVEAEAATAALRGGEAPLLAGAARLTLAEAQEAAGDHASAIISARAAHALGRRLGCPALLDRSAAALRRLGAAPPRPDAAAVADAVGALTVRERDVLELICAGRTNAEIAATLFLSAKTVEHHVGRVLAKLGVRTRTEAAAHASTLGRARA